MCMWVQIFKHFEIMESWKSHWISKLIKEFSFMRSISSCVLLCIFLQVFSSYFCSFFQGAIRFCFSHIHSLFCLNMVFFSIHLLTHSFQPNLSIRSHLTSFCCLMWMNCMDPENAAAQTTRCMYIFPCNALIIRYYAQHMRQICLVYMTMLSFWRMLSA